MSKTKTGANAQFTSAGKGLTVIGKHAYAYSGILNIDNNLTTMLEFQTGKEYIVAKSQPFYHQTGDSDNFKYIWLFNGIEIQSVQLTHAVDYTPYDEIHLIIPPLTLVEVKASNVSSGGARDIGVTLVGEIHNG